MSALWTVEAMATAMAAERHGALPQSISGISIDSRTIAPGEAFFALQGDHRDGHEFVAAALAAKAGLAVVAADRRGQFPEHAPLLVVPDVLAALRDLAAAARARTAAKVIGVTGSVGKTSTKEALRLALAKDGETHASVASYNNHWGVPLSLARLPARRALRGARNGHESCRRDRAAVAARPPACRGDHDHRAGASGILRHADQDRRRQGRDFSRTRARRRRRAQPRQSRSSRIWRAAPTKPRSRASCRSASTPKADARLIKCALHPRCSTVQADILGTELTYKIGAPGRHIVVNSLAVLAVAELAGADLALAALALAELKAISGRGAPVELDLPGGGALLIDESYNANPVSVDAALALLGQAPIGPQGRRIAVLGDMLELGPKGKALHRGLAAAVEANAIDLVFCCGPLMHSLWQALPAGRCGGYAEDSAALEAQVVPAIRAGDVVMVKGSLGSRMAPIVKALQRVYPHHDTLEDASA